VSDINYTDLSSYGNFLLLLPYQGCKTN